MEADSTLSSLLASLRVDGPWTPPATWESIPSESGAHLPGDRRRHRDPIYEPASVPDSALVRLSLHALHGVKSSLVEIEELSLLFCSSPADRTSHRVPNVWSRTSSTTSLGQILKSIGCTGLEVFFLDKFVHFYLFCSREMDCENREKGHEDDICRGNDVGICAPYSLVNQAFAVAVEKVLEGYFCSLNTLAASIKLRRSVGEASIHSGVTDEASGDTKVANSEVTLLEVYLHTEELRRQIKSLGNICFPKFADLALCQEGLTTDTKLEFQNFPRGADLLSYLYVHLRDADPVHYGLLKYLFIRSCEPYCDFIKSWIYRACVNDPYEEFLVAYEDDKQSSNGAFGSLDNLSMLPVKGIEVLLHKREAMYKMMIEKLHYLFSQIEVIPFDTSPSLLHGRNISTLDTLVSDGDSMLSATTNAVTAINMSADQKDNDAACTSNESSDEVDALQSSECSSSYSSAEEIRDEEDAACDNLSNSKLSSYYASVGGSQSFSGTRKLFSTQNSCSVRDGIYPTSPISEHHADGNLSQNCFPVQLGNKECDAMNDALQLDHQCSSFWPFGGVLKNTLYNNSDQMCSAKDSAHTTYSSAGKQVSLGELIGPFCCKAEPPSLMNTRNVHESYINQSWTTSNRYNLSINPVVTNAAWHHIESDLKDKSYTRNQGFPCFNFEAVTNPCEVCSGRDFSCSDDSSEVGATMLLGSTTNASKVAKSSDDFFEAKVGGQAATSLVCSSREASVSENLQPNTSGGALWAGSLDYVGESVKCTSEESTNALEPFSDMPIDVVIDKCIVQEVLLQYKYVSNFTIRLLEEGFDFRGHLLALRRYHFMELADWADSFIISVCRKKWTIVEPGQKRAEIQGLLDLALQRSSCDSDPYKERLFVYMKEQQAVPLSASARVAGLDIFDSILLGYRVDWPINIIVTEDALKIYAEIFCYLVQVRLAVFSLTEIWCFLEKLLQVMTRSKHMRPDVLGSFNSLIRVRQQIHHFLSMLQQYLHCHLSDISWCHLQHSLKHQVRDMLDLESVHLSYLTDALRICFLSIETKPIAAIIRNMLQCALELRSCFMNLNMDAEPGIDQLNLHSLINFSQVRTVRNKFESNIKDLYILYSKSPKHGELGLSRFWGYLNYNEYYSSAISKDTAYFYF